MSSHQPQSLSIPGLFYVDHLPFSTSSIIPKLDEKDWTPLSPHCPTSRLVQHYGYKYNYTTYDITEKCEYIPDFLIGLRNHLTDTCKTLKIIPDTYTFNQCIVNNYMPGQGISPHIDVTKYGDVIGCFTFGSGAEMVFSHKFESDSMGLYVKPNSLYIMSGESRYMWKHSMPNRKSDKVDGKRI